jgi:hypothetical protein
MCEKLGDAGMIGYFNCRSEFLEPAQSIFEAARPPFRLAITQKPGSSMPPYGYCDLSLRFVTQLDRANGPLEIKTASLLSRFQFPSN